MHGLITSAHLLAPAIMWASYPSITVGSRALRHVPALRVIVQGCCGAVRKICCNLSALKGAAITRDRRSRLGKDNLILSAVRAAIDAVLRYSGKT